MVRHFRTLPSANRCRTCRTIRPDPPACRMLDRPAGIGGPVADSSPCRQHGSLSASATATTSRPGPPRRPLVHREVFLLPEDHRVSTSSTTETVPERSDDMTSRDAFHVYDTTLRD